MTNNTFQQHFNNSRYYKLLSEDSQFYSDDYNFTFAFQPTDPTDPELVEAERLDLASRFDAFAAQWAKKCIDSYLGGSLKIDTCSIENFDKSLFQEFSEKIFVAFLTTLPKQGWSDETRYDIHTSNRFDRNETSHFNWSGTGYGNRGLSLEFRELIFGKSFNIFSGHYINKLSSRQKSVRLSYAKNNFPDLVDEDSELYQNNRYLRHGLRDHYHHIRYYDREEGGENWFKIILENYRSFLSHPVLEELKKKHEISINVFNEFSQAQMTDIVTINNYMLSDELQTKGKSLKDATVQTKQAVDSHDSTFRTDLLFENHEAEVQKKFTKDVLEPARERATFFGAIQLPEDHVLYEDAKQAIMDNREEQKRLEELEREKQRQEIIAQREAVRLAREKELEECLDNFMIMLRDSGHGHGHKDREGNEKLWYGSEELAAKDALKLAKKSDRLLKPYRVTLYTEMDQPVHGWFLTSAVDSRKAA